MYQSGSGMNPLISILAEFSIDFARTLPSDSSNKSEAQIVFQTDDSSTRCNTPNEIHPRQNQDYKKKTHKGRSLGTSLYIFT